MFGKNKPKEEPKAEEKPKEEEEKTPVVEPTTDQQQQEQPVQILEVLNHEVLAAILENIQRQNIILTELVEIAKNESG